MQHTMLYLVEQGRMDNVELQLSGSGAQEEVIRVVKCGTSMAQFHYPLHCLSAENHTTEEMWQIS